MQLHVFANGSKLWRRAYRYGGKQKTFSMGSYPELSLQDARVAWKGSVALLIKRRNFPWNGTVPLKLDGPFLPT